MMEFDHERRDHFKEAYGQAVRDAQADFMFEGNQFATSYARYMLQYLNACLGRTN